MSIEQSNSAEGFGPLRFVRETHYPVGESSEPQQDTTLEVIQIPLSGTLACEGDTDEAAALKPGDVQVMSCGTGLSHREFNGSDEQDLRFLEIGMAPNFDNTTANYRHKFFDPDQKKNTFLVVVSPYGEYGSLCIRQRARLFAGQFDKGNATAFDPSYGCQHYLHVISGEAQVNGQTAKAGVSLAIVDEKSILVKSLADSEIIIVEVPVEA